MNIAQLEKAKAIDNLIKTVRGWRQIYKGATYTQKLILSDQYNNHFSTLFIGMNNADVQNANAQFQKYFREFLEKCDKDLEEKEKSLMEQLEAI